MFIINLVKKLFFFIQGLFVYSFFALPAFAQTSANLCNNPTGIATVLCGLGGASGENIAKTLQNVVVFFIVLSVIIALFFLLYGGIKWITSKGEKEGVESARNHIMAAIMGLIIVFLAVFILSVILSAFGLNFASLTIPKIIPTP